MMFITDRYEISIRQGIHTHFTPSFIMYTGAESVVPALCITVIDDILPLDRNDRSSLNNVTSLEVA